MKIPAIWGQFATITPGRLPDVTTIPTPTCCWPQRSVQLLASEVSADYYTSINQFKTQVDPQTLTLPARPAVVAHVVTQASVPPLPKMTRDQLPATGSDVIAVADHGVEFLEPCLFSEHHAALSEHIGETRVQDAPGWLVVTA